MTFFLNYPLQIAAITHGAMRSIPARSYLVEQDASTEAGPRPVRMRPSGNPRPPPESAHNGVMGAGCLRAKGVSLPADINTDGSLRRTPLYADSGGGRGYPLGLMRPGRGPTSADASCSTK